MLLQDANPTPSFGGFGLSGRDPAVAVLESLGEPLYLMEENPTAENIARHVYQNARRLGLEVTEVRLWETPSSRATYRER